MTTPEIERPKNPHCRDLMFYNSCDFILDNSDSKLNDLYLYKDGYDWGETSPMTSPRGYIFDEVLT